MCLRFKASPSKNYIRTFSAPYPIQSHHSPPLQDAHVPPGLLPPIPCPDTHTVRNADTSPSAWGDIYTAVRNAKHLIYIATWQLTHTSRALPPAENAAEKPLEGPTIGELLKQKAEEGVRVNIILWDVVSSKLKRNPLAATKAVDLTHNGAAVDYFKGTSRSDVQKRGGVLLTRRMCERTFLIGVLSSVAW